MLDYYKVSEMFTSEERQTQEMVRAFLDENVIPNINHWWEEETFPSSLVPDLGRLGLLGANLPARYGTAGISNVAYGLVMYELERADSGLRSFVSVQGALVMYPIHVYGSEEQQIKYLPKLAKGEFIGCFGLTEHEGGSDPGVMSTRARKEGSGYVLNGRKMWISNGNVADVALIWALDEDGVVHPNRGK